MPNGVVSSEQATKEVETGKKVQLNFLVYEEDRDRLDGLVYFVHKYGFIDAPQRSKLLDFMATQTYNWMRIIIQKQREKGG